jgi:dTDP-4-amino-4,6-dideoxygalactose transaminase
MRIFGLDRDGRIVDPGTNAKMSELNAAMGLALLDHMPAVLADRKVSYLDYRERLTGLPGIRFQRVDESETNFSYFPVVFEREADRTRVLEVLRSQNIHPRIYFDTSLDQVDYLADGRECPNSRLLTRKILCLPLFNGMPGEDRARTCDLIRSALD